MNSQGMPETGAYREGYLARGKGTIDGKASLGTGVPKLVSVCRAQSAMSHMAQATSSPSRGWPAMKSSPSHRSMRHESCLLFHELCTFFHQALYFPHLHFWWERGSVGRIERGGSRVGSLTRGLSSSFGAGEVGRQRQARHEKQSGQEIWSAGKMERGGRGARPSEDMREKNRAGHP